MRENIDEKSKKPYEVKVFFEYTHQAEGHYYTADEGDYEREEYSPGKWTRSIIVENFLAKDIDSAFEKEDGDYDWNLRILYITDEKGRILYDSYHYKTIAPHNFFDYRDAVDKTAKELYEKLQTITENYKKEYDRYTKEARENIKRLGGVEVADLEVD